MMCTRLAFLKTWGGLKSAGRTTLELCEGASVAAVARALDTRPSSAVASENGFMMTGDRKGRSLTMRTLCCAAKFELDAQCNEWRLCS